MLIEIDTDTLKRLKLSANQLICLRLLMDKKNQKEMNTIGEKQGLKMTIGKKQK